MIISIELYTRKKRNLVLLILLSYIGSDEEVSMKIIFSPRVNIHSIPLTSIRMDFTHTHTSIYIYTCRRISRSLADLE